MAVLSDLYRPLRSLAIGGPIDAALVESLGPRISELRASSADPITLLIDSSGGQVASARALRSLFRRGPRGLDPAELRTLAIGTAGGAAADLLIGGDVVAALASATIRVEGEANGRSGAPLARRIFPRMLDTLRRVSGHPDRYGPAADMFADEIDAGLDRTLHGLSLLAGAMWTELPAGPDEMVQDAVADFLRFRVVREECERPDYAPPEALLLSLRHLDAASRAEGEHSLRVMNYLLARFADADDDPPARADQVAEAARCLEYYTDWSPRHFHGPLLQAVLDHEDVFFDVEERAEARRLAVAGEEGSGHLAQLAYRRAEPIWAFTLSIARSLREEGRTLDAVSAWWLGLLDIVVGTDLDRREQE